MKNRTLAFLFMTLIYTTLTVGVYGDVPTTLTITRRSEGSNAIIDVKVRHADPTSAHFISQINLDLDGTIKAFTDLPKATTSETTYSINIGSTSPKVIKAQAVCNIHGAGSYYSEAGTGGTSGGGGIPAYPSEAMVIGTLLGFIFIIILTKRH